MGQDRKSPARQFKALAGDVPISWMIRLSDRLFTRRCARRFR
jgi:hypothetical protein